METDSPQVGSADDETNIGMGQVDGHMRSSCSQEEVCRGLADQCRELSDSIEAYTIAVDKYFGLVGTLGIGALAILVGNSSSEKVLAVIVVLPIVLAVILHYVCQLLTEKAARSGAKQALEERLAVIAPGGQFKLEEHLSTVVGQRRRSVIISILLYGLFLIALVFGAGRAAISLDGGVCGRVFWGLTVALASLSVALGVSAREMLTAYDRSLTRARRDSTTSPSS